MELAQMRMVKAVAETGSIALAAQRLHCVPSNITTRIKHLESELGTDLFVRAGRGLSISPAGEVFLEYCAQILNLVDEAKRAVDANTRPSGTLRIGAIESCATVHLPALLAEYHRTYPEVSLELITGTWTQLLEDVRQRRLDGALVAADIHHPKIASTALYSEKLVLISAADSAPIHNAHDLLGRTLIMWPNGCPYRAALKNWVQDCDRNPPIASYGSWGTIIGSVNAGAGVSLVPEGILRRYEQSTGLATYRFDELAPVQNSFIWHRETTRHPAREAFARLLRERLEARPE
ncbi:LysR family transcriptional regulator [Pseudomonas gingeri]|uniref:LysR family transcriptional regulator n=1 Tax=Pseudomonas gingeri TaxID=117681 RepID=UPI0015BC9157|nr:LysR substrate-binding domain-containing protein [Pseudomonas gingeri]NWE73293.1 LysR family transcriptional regulator [Pseudomonas gingeri]